MAGLESEDAAPQRRSGEIEVPQQVHKLVPDALVGEPQVNGYVAVQFQHDGILDSRSLAEALLYEGVHFRAKDKRARRRDLS